MISTFWEAALVLLGGVWAGTINTVVGSGTLVSFPILVAVGLPPVTANVSNSVGLVPGSMTGAWGYRRELAGQGHRLRWLVPATTLGGILGAVLLLWLPSAAFEAIVPVLIALGVLLVVFGPRIQRVVAAHHEERGGLPDRGAWWVWPAVFGIGIDDHVQRHNAVKNVLAALVNAVAAVVFILVAPVDWRAVVLLAVGAVIGGVIGSSVGRRLSPTLLRAVIVVVGVVALVSFLV